MAETVGVERSLRITRLRRSATLLYVPRVGNRQLIALRMSPSGIDYIDTLAGARGISRSEMIRIMIAYASTHMPRDWKPRKEQ